MIAKDVRKVLRQFKQILELLARQGRHVELRDRFEDFHRLLDTWLDIAPEASRPPDPFRGLAVVDIFHGPIEIDMWDIARAATLSGDTDTVVTMSRQMFRAASKCSRRQQPYLMEEYLKVIAFLYQQSGENPRLADAVAGQIDTGLYGPFFEIGVWVRERGGEEFELEGVQEATVDVWLRFALLVTNTAIRFGYSRHAKHFLERIFTHRTHPARVAQRKESMPSATSLRVLFDYVAIVLLGWSLHVLQRGVKARLDAASSVFVTTVGQLPSIPVLIHEWEVVGASIYGQEAFGRRLGVANWDMPDRGENSRVGVVVSWSGGGEWIRLGFRAALLVTRERAFGDDETLFSNQSLRNVWHPQEERSALESLSRSEFLNIPEQERTSRIDRAIRIIEKRARRANADYLRYVIRADLSEQKVSQFRIEAIKAFREMRPWQRVIRAAGIDCVGAIQSKPPQVGYRMALPREYLLDESDWATGLGDELGRRTAGREAMMLIHQIESSVPSHASLDALARLPELVRAARRKLVETGNSPNLVILPLEDRFARALHQKPLWQVEGRAELGEADLGIWEEMRVMRFPYSDSKTILVLDTRLAFCESAEKNSEQAVQVEIDEDPSEVGITEAKQEAIAALGAANILPQSTSIHVVAWMAADPEMMVFSLDAATSIDITNSDGGYAILPDSETYHRASCQEIEFEDVEFTLRLPPGRKFMPCDICHPERTSAEWRRQGTLDDDVGPSQESGVDHNQL